MFANTPSPPYYAVIFVSKRSLNDEGYNEMNERIDNLVKNQDGYIDNEAARNAEGFGIHISYWKTKESIENWKHNSLHNEAKKLGKEKWYEKYTLKIAKVEIEY